MFLVLLFPGTFRSNIQEYEEKIYWKQWYADPGTRVPTGTPADCIAGNPIPRIAAITKNCVSTTSINTSSNTRNYVMNTNVHAVRCVLPMCETSHKSCN